MTVWMEWKNRIDMQWVFERLARFFCPLLSRRREYDDEVGQQAASSWREFKGDEHRPGNIDALRKQPNVSICHFSSTFELKWLWNV